MCDFNQLREWVAQSPEKKRGEASCNLAEYIWSGSVTEDQVLCLLKNENDNVRSSAAWAVADIASPRIGVKWLCKHGIHDSCAGVRVSALLCIFDSRELKSAISDADRIELLSDPDSQVRAFAVRIWEEQETTGNRSAIPGE